MDKIGKDYWNNSNKVENLVDVGMGNLVISAPLDVEEETLVGKGIVSRHNCVRDYEC